MTDEKKDASYTSLHSLNIEIWENIIFCRIREKMFSIKSVAIGSHYY